MNNKKIIFFFLCLGNVAISFNIGAVAAAIPIIAKDFALSDLVVSKIVPFYMIPYGLGALLYAPLTRYFTYRTILIAAMAVFAVASFVAGMSQSLSSLQLAQIGAGVAAASSTPLSLMIIGELFDKDMRGRLVGMYFGTSFLASVVGMIFMGLWDWRLLFFVPAAVGAINAFCWMFLQKELLNHRHKESVNYFKAVFKNHIRDVFIFIFCASFLYHGVHKWYGVYLAQEYGFGKEMISLVLIVAAVSGLAGQQIGGYLSDKKGRLFACYIGLLGLSAGVMLLAGHYPTVLLVAVLALVAIGWTVSHNSISTILTDFPDEDRPIIASLNSSVRFVSGGLGFSLSKFFVEKSFGWTFLGIGILMALLIFYVKKATREATIG